MKAHRNAMGGCGFVCLGLFAVMLASLRVFAQAPTSTILGVVKDTTGGTVAGAMVTLTNTETGIARTTTTGDDGAYRFPALNVGNYQVQVMKDGFQTALRNGIVLEVAESAAIDVVLELGATGQTVVVTGEAPLVQTTSSTGGGLVNEQQVTDLPLNGRDLVDLTLMQAGISQTSVLPTQTQVFGMQTGVTLSANGAGPHSNNVLLDGANMLNFWGLNGSSILGTTLGVDGVKEYKVVTILPDAEYGLQMGAQSISVSKGGTNQWHGDAFEYLRNSSMDARNYFDALDHLNFNGDGTDKSAVFPGKRIPPFHRNNYGGSVGGPIKKDKLFFYAVYEGLRVRQGQTITTTTLPGNCFDQTAGDSTFHQITQKSLLSCTTLSQTAPPAINQAVLSALSTPNIVQGYVGLFPYPNVNINAAGIQIPGATFNYSFPYILPQFEDYGQVRGDYNISNSDSLFVRYTQDDSRENLNGSYPYQVVNEFGSGQYGTISETHIFSANILNTFRSSFSRNLIKGDGTTNVPFNPAFLEVPGEEYGGFTPYSGITGSSGSSDGEYINGTYSFSDDIYWTKGKHGLKFGELFDWNRDPYSGDFNRRGSIAFTSVNNLYQGIYSTMSALGGTLSPSQNRQFQYMTQGLYAQDDYRATSRLMLNLGFRYEFTTIPTDMNGGNWNIQNVATANGDGPTQGSVQGAFWGNNPSLHAFSPRVGFAWDPFGKGTTAIRGGGGIYYDVSNFGGLFSNLACCDPPLDYFLTVSNSYTSVAQMTANGYPQFAYPLPIAYGSAPVSATNPNGVVSNVHGTIAPRNWVYNQKQPTMYQWNLTLDRQLPANEDLTVAYVGTKGIHLVNLEEGNPTDITQINPATGNPWGGYLANGLPYFCHPLDNPTGPPTATDQCPTSASYPAKSNPTYGIVNQNSDSSSSWYEALQVTWTQRNFHGLEGGVALTWSKAEDMGEAQQGDESSAGEQTYFPSVNPLDKGLSGFNAAINMHGNVIYHLPAFSKFRGVTNGWWVGSIVTAVSGYPFNPTIGNRSLSNDPDTAGAAVDRPNLDPSFNLGSIITHNPSNWLNESMYDLPIAGTLGNAPRFGLRGPDLVDFDFSVNKDTKVRQLGEAGMIEARAEVFNIANHPNFATPSASLSSALASPQCGGGLTMTCQFNEPGAAANATLIAPTSTVGQITSTTNRSRQIQLSLKVIF